MLHPGSRSVAFLLGLLVAVPFFGAGTAEAGDTGITLDARAGPLAQEDVVLIVPAGLRFTLGFDPVADSRDDSPGERYSQLWTAAADTIDDADVIPEQPMPGFFLEENVTMTMKHHGHSGGRNIDALLGGSGVPASTLRVAAPDAPSRLDVPLA